MLKIKPIREINSRVNYHFHGTGLSDDEKRGTWLGGGVHAAGYDANQPITAESLASGLAGYGARNQYLGQRISTKRRAGWDVVLSPHKSISIAALCLPPPVASKVRRAWEAAVRATVTAMESLACRCRTGGPPVATGNLMVATFTHERSRRDDPHLHTHCIVMNATLDPAAGWRGLEPARIYRNNMNLDGVLQHELARQLDAEGLPCERDAKGRAFLSMPADLIARLSTAKRILDDILSGRDEIAALDKFRTKPTHIPTIRNILNDRLRPPKRPPAKRPADFLTSGERRSLTAKFSPRPPKPAQGPPPPASIAKDITKIYHRRTLWHVSKRLFSAMLETAKRMPSVPFDAFLATIPLIPAPRSYSGPSKRTEEHQWLAAVHRSHPRAAALEHAKRAKTDRKGPSKTAIRSALARSAAPPNARASLFGRAALLHSKKQARLRTVASRTAILVAAAAALPTGRQTSHSGGRSAAPPA